MQSPGIPTARAKAIPLTPLKEAEQLAVAYAHSLGIEGDGAQALAALRALPAEKLIEGASGDEVLAALAKGEPVIGVSGSIIDGTFLTETPEGAFAAGHQAKVPIIVGANNRDLGLGVASSKDDLFALFGNQGGAARKLYDPDGTATLDELKVQVFMDMTMVEPSRHLADTAARAGQPTWWYRFSYVAEALRADPKWKGTLHGFEIPYTLDLPAALVGNEVTDTDKAMAETASGYWVAFAKTGDPNSVGRPQWPRHDPSVDRVIDFTNNGVVVGPDPLKARLDLWQQVRSANH
jgi:para-nitrobenzyl esterase